MFPRQLRILALTLVLSAGAAQAQEYSKQIAKGGAVALQPSIVSLAETHEGLAAQFRRLGETATGATARAADRQALVRFVRTAIVPQLKIESVVLFTAFDSIVGGGYAVPATLFDLDAINSLVKETERTTGDSARYAFNERTYALSIALEGYFTKVELLVLPVLNQRLSGQALSAVFSRLETGRSTP